MPTSGPRTSAATRRRVERSAGALSTAAIRRMETNHDWYRALSAEDRSWVGLVAQAGIGAFIAWYRDPVGNPHITADVFGTAPRELTRSISLGQTLDLVRSMVDVVEDEVVHLAAPGEEQGLREAVLRYSREIAFAAAQVYAEAAEARGAWDARLESLVVDAVLRGEADDSMQSRAAALGWGTVSHVVEVAGSTAAALATHFGDGPIVVGPTVPHLFAAGRSARAALSGLVAAPAWPDAPRIVESEALLPERALAGDPPARRILVDRVHRPLAAAAQAPLLRTATAYLESGGSLEATARALFVHANTVRYRLGRISDLTGYDLATPREAWVVRIALAVGRLAGEGRSIAVASRPQSARTRSTLGSKVEPYAVPPGRQSDLLPRGL